MRILSLRNGFTLTSLLLSVFPVCMFVLMLPHLPQFVPVHFTIGGQPDRWAEPFSFHTVLLGSMSLIGFVLMKLMQYVVTMPLMGLRGAKDGVQATHRLFDIMTLCVTTLFAAFSLYTQYMMQTAGQTFDTSFYIGAPCVFAGMLFIGAGHLVTGNTGRSKVSKLSLSVCGTLIVLLSLIPYTWTFICIGVTLAAMLLIPLVYSMASKKQPQQYKRAGSA